MDDIKLAGKKQDLMWKTSMKHVDPGEPTSFLDHVYLGCTQRDCKSNESMIDEYRKMFGSRIPARATEKLTGWETSHANTIAWSYDMAAHAKKGVARYCELARLSSLQRSLLPVLKTVSSKKKKNWKRCGNCQTSEIKLS